MPVHKDPSGRRSVQAEAEVPGTPEDVWQAIATGPGISSWFVPTELDEREGGTTVSHFSPDGSMDSVATIQIWEPPHRFVAETHEGPGPVATEWIVEARDGGTCVVRVVHSWFASTDDWDAQFEGHTHGWAAFFRILRLCLQHFRGLPSASFQVMAVAPEPKSEVWERFTGALGLGGVEVGQRVRASADAPPLAGIVERAGQPEWPEELLIRLEEPAPGLVHSAPFLMGGQVYLWMRFYLYGEEAATTVQRIEPIWQAWLSRC
jgi:uncharacterized protein YndB with AHSA1/START domain